MKAYRPILLLTLLLSLPSFLWSQQKVSTKTELPPADSTGFRGKWEPRPRLYLGAGAGLSASTVLFKPVVGTSLLLGTTAAVMARMEVTSFGAVGLECLYTQTGWAESVDGKRSYTYTLDNIELPLLSHLHMDFGRTRCFLNIGPSIGWVLRHKSQVRASIPQTDAQRLRHSLPLESRFRWGLTGGPGLGIDLGRRIGRIEIEARVYFGLDSYFSTKPNAPYASSYELSGGLRMQYLFCLGDL